MKRKLLFCLLVGCILTGCSAAKIDTSEENTNNRDRFETLSYEDYGYIIYDTQTGVEYWKSNSTYNRGDLTVLVDADGKPLIYEGGK